MGDRPGWDAGVGVRVCKKECVLPWQSQAPPLAWRGRPHRVKFLKTKGFLQTKELAPRSTNSNRLKDLTFSGPLATGLHAAPDAINQFSCAEGFRCKLLHALGLFRALYYDNKEQSPRKCLKSRQTTR